MIKKVLLILRRRRRFWSGGALEDEFIRGSHRRDICFDLNKLIILPVYCVTRSRFLEVGSPLWTEERQVLNRHWLV